MPEDQTRRITQLLQVMADQNGPPRKQTYDELVVLLYDELKRTARQQLRGERADSMQPTRLVHDVYDRLLAYRMTFVNREHFLSVAATAMRRVLIERARRLSADRRGGRQAHDTIDETLNVAVTSMDPDDLLDLDRAMGVLTPEQVQLTELRFFAGCTMEETASTMGLNIETARKRWVVIKTLLFHELQRGIGSP